MKNLNRNTKTLLKDSNGSVENNLEDKVNGGNSVVIENTYLSDDITHPLTD